MPSTVEESKVSGSKAPELFEAIWEAKEKHGENLSPEALQEVLDTLRDYPEFFFLDETPKVSTIRAHAFQAQARDQMVAVFSHSLERNGANIFLQILLQYCTDQERQEFELFSPSDGPLRKAFEKMGVKVHVMNPGDQGYMDKLEKRLQAFGAVFANTIMRAEVVRTAQKMGLPYTWVIHEAWPREQFDWYASKVFLQEGINAGIIKEAFGAAEPDKGNVIFPAKVQMGLYDGLIDSRACQVIYNGIPVDSIDAFQKQKDRKAIRAELGYSEQDFLVLHLGTVCSRKCQHVTAEAFSKLVNDKGADNAKLLIVGARYIRQHEIEYIDKVKATLREGGVEERATILDIQAEVLKYYMAADVVLVPSKNEVLPLVIAEAQAFQRPLVVSDIDGLPEAVADGQEGFLVPPEDAQALCDAIDKFHKDADLAVRTGALGRVRALHQFSHKAMTLKYEAIIDAMAPPPEQLLSAPAPAAEEAVPGELASRAELKRRAMGLPSASQVPLALRQV